MGFYAADMVGGTTIVAVLGKLREIITHHLPTPGGAISEPGAWPIIRECLLCLCMIVLVFHMYVHSKDGPFVFDDLPNIAGNPHIQISRLDWQSLRRAAFESPIPTRPVSNISFALNYYFTKLDPNNFRLINVLIHLGNGLLLLLFLKATLQTPALRDRNRSLSRFMPFMATTIWVVNPIHTQSISYIIQRMTSMATLFYLLAFLLYIYARLSKEQRWRWLLFGSSLLAFLVALGTKENTITLPFFIFLYEWYFFRDLDWGWLKRNLWWPLIILFFWMGMAFIYLDFNPIVKSLSVYQSVDLTLLQRLMTQSRIVIFYVFLFLFPHPSRLNLDHHFPVSLSPLDPPTTLLAMLAIVALFATAVICTRRQRFLSFCILWFMGNLLIESSVPGLDMVFEHRTYLPSVLISMLVVMFLYHAVTIAWIRRVVFVLFVVTGTFWTHERNMIWADKITLWEDIAKKSPGKVRPNINLGIAYSQIGQFEKGIRYLQQAVKLKPDYVHPRINLAISYYANGDYRKAEKHARAILPMKPIDRNSLDLLVKAQNIVGKSLAQQGELDKAMDHFYQGLQLNPDDAETNFNLSLTLASEGQLEKAARYCSEALRLQPDYRGARQHLQEVRRQIKLHKPSNDRPFSKEIANLR